MAVGGRSDQGNTRTALVISAQTDLPLGLTISKRCATHCSKQEQTIASGAPRTAPDHSNLILPLTEIGGIFDISFLVVPRGEFILVKIQVVGNRGDQGNTSYH